MAVCQECDSALDIDEEEITEGDSIVCDECGAEYEVVSTDPLELARQEEGYEDEDDLFEEEAEE